MEENDQIESLYIQTGYSNKGEKMNDEDTAKEAMLYYYSKPTKSLMTYTDKRTRAKKFDLRKQDIAVIIKAITESAAYQRASQKSMMATRSPILLPREEIKDPRFIDSEALVQTRQTHMREVAEISKMISDALGLNSDLTYLIGLLHDVGHTWNGHSGERILSSIARYRNCGYIVHNAMGAYIIERENIIKNAMEELKQFNPEIDEKEVERFMRYVIDGIVSHNGEGVVGKIIPQDKSYEQMMEEIRKCFTEKGYDKMIMPATMEGAIIRYADIIAYTRSDILDGFRLRDANGEKIINEFDNDYLSIIGTLLARKNNNLKPLDLENKLLLEIYKLSSRIKKIEARHIEDITPEERVELERTKKEKKMLDAKYEDLVKWKIEYAKAYISSIEPRGEVKNRVTQMMQNVFIMDLIENSKNKDYITMSPLIRKTFFALRDLNVRKIVPYTRRQFEIEDLSIATEGLVDIFTDVLIKTGIVYRAIPDSEKENMDINIEQQQEEERKIEEGKGVKYEKKLCHYYKNLSKERMKEIYINAVNAIKDIASHDLNIALGYETYEGELKEIYEANKIMKIRNMIHAMGKNEDTVTDEDKKRLLEEIINQRKKDIVRIVASKMAIEYIGGMTDNTILLVLSDKNLISRKKLENGYGRSFVGDRDQGIKNLQNAFAKNDAMILPDNEEKGINL